MPLKREPSGSGWRIFLKAALLIAFLVAGNYLARGLADSLDIEIRVGNEDKVHRTIIVSAALYVFLLAIPFVPGAEIGLGLIALLGPPITFLVYVCTVAGLSLAYFAGRAIPPAVLARWSEEASLTRVAELLKTMEPMDQEMRARFLANTAPTNLLPFLLRHRYIALAAALNIPGNFLIGGGGGIALFAGVSRLYSIPGFVATIMISVAPVPLAVIFLGKEILS